MKQTNQERIQQLQQEIVYETKAGEYEVVIDEREEDEK